MGVATRFPNNNLHEHEQLEILYHVLNNGIDLEDDDPALGTDHLLKTYADKRYSSTLALASVRAHIGDGFARKAGVITESEKALLKRCVDENPTGSTHAARAFIQALDQKIPLLGFPTFRCFSRVIAQTFSNYPGRYSVTYDGRAKATPWTQGEKLTIRAMIDAKESSRFNGSTFKAFA